MVDYDYIKNPYRLIAVDLRRQSENGDSIYQIEFVEQLKYIDCVNVYITQSM